MKAPVVVTILVATANLLTAQALELCIGNPARLDKDTLEAFRTELDRVLTASGRSATYGICRAGTISITLRSDPPEQEPDALGRIRQRDGSLVPEIELFASSTAGIIGTRMPAVLGRALARVATHELIHWLSQTSAHNTRGPLVERLDAAHLTASEHGFFLVPPGD